MKHLCTECRHKLHGADAPDARRVCSVHGCPCFVKPWDLVILCRATELAGARGEIKVEDGSMWWKVDGGSWNRESERLTDPLFVLEFLPGWVDCD